MASSTGPLIASGVAVLLAYAAIKGKNPESLLRAGLSGKSPQSAADLPITIPTAGGGTGGGGGSGTGAGSLSADVMQYEGRPYVWGGAFANGGGGDCSGLVNRCWMHDMGQTGPLGSRAQGEGFTDGAHGPVTGMWFVSSILTTIPASQMQPGDIACWLTHMGIIIGDNEMMNAEKPGTVVSKAPVIGFITGEPLRIRRFNA